MTGAQFYEKLAEAGKRMVWDVNESGILYGRFRYAKVDRCFCPITAVCYLTKKKYYDRLEPYDAAFTLGLNEDFAYNIIRAADEFGKYSKKVRRHLKKVLGLS